MRLRFLLAPGLGIAALAGAGMGVASAQYPAPLGVCVVTPSSANVQTNSVVTFTVQTLDTEGKPFGNVPVSVQGGGTATTDSDGRVTLSVPAGTSTGTMNINVRAGAAGLSCAAAVSVVAPRVNPDVIKPPDTGTGFSMGGLDTGLLALGAAALALTGGAAVAGARRRA